MHGEEILKVYQKIEQNLPFDDAINNLRKLKNLTERLAYKEKDPILLTNFAKVYSRFTIFAERLATKYRLGQIMQIEQLKCLTQLKREALKIKKEMP